jgi:hypothetical protein
VEGELPGYAQFPARSWSDCLFLCQIVDTAVKSSALRHVPRPLCAAQVKANVRYSIVLERIQPLEGQLAEAVAALDRAQARLTECEDELAGASLCAPDGPPYIRSLCRSALVLRAA